MIPVLRLVLPELRVWDGTHALLPEVANRAGLGSALEKVALARAIPVRGGKGVDEIARQRGTSVRTVANQAQSIYQKLGVGSRVELAACLVRRAAGT